MKTIKVISVFLVLSLLGFSSCRKIEKKEDIGTSKTIANLKISQAFKWETTRIIDVSLTATRSGVVYINPTKGDFCFNKGLLSSSTGYNTRITVPSYVNEVNLVFNRKTYQVPIVGNNLAFSFK
jgi:hypothetical protein